MNPQAQQRLDDYIKQINSPNPNDWPKSIDLSNLGLTDEDIHPLWDAISNNRNAARAIVNLNLYNNKLTSFRVEGLGALRSLNLSRNDLTDFSAEGLGALQELRLNINQLTSFSGEGLETLQVLDLAFNQLTSFNGEGFGALHSLNLNNNQLTSFSSEGLGALQLLSLRGSQLTSFSGEGLETLQGLVLDNNKLTSFSGEGFGALQDLRLNSNQLTSFRGEGLGALQRLSLTDNQLTSFSGEGFGALQSLGLAYNQLTSFSGKGLGALQTLFLHNNQLLTIFSGEGLGAVHMLVLYDNQLTSVCKIMLEAMRLNVPYLDYGNRIYEQALTNEMLTEHFNAVLDAIQRELSAKSWLSAIRGTGLPDELCRIVFKLANRLDHIPREMDRIKRALPGQIQNLEAFEKSRAFAEIIEQYDENINSLYEDSFRDARTMETLLTAYKRHGKYTTNLRYLQDNSRLDPKDNPFQLALRN